MQSNFNIDFGDIRFYFFVLKKNFLWNKSFFMGDLGIYFLIA